MYSSTSIQDLLVPALLRWSCSGEMFFLLLLPGTDLLGEMSFPRARLEPGLGKQQHVLQECDHDPDPNPGFHLGTAGALGLLFLWFGKGGQDPVALVPGSHTRCMDFTGKSSRETGRCSGEPGRFLMY